MIVLQYIRNYHLKCLFIYFDLICNYDWHPLNSIGSLNNMYHLHLAHWVTSATHTQFLSHYIIDLAMFQCCIHYSLLNSYPSNCSIVVDDYSYVCHVYSNSGSYCSTD